MNLRKISHVIFGTLVTGCMLGVSATPTLAYAETLLDVDSMSSSRRPSVCIDPGHGGFDSGACHGGLREADLTLKIGKYLRDELQADGYRVLMTRQSNSSLTDNTADELKARPQFAKDYNCDLFVSLHINSSGGHGSEVWVPNDSSWKKSETVVPARKAAQDTLDAIVDLGFYNRGLKHKSYPSDGTDESVYPDGSSADYLGVIRYARRLGMPAYLVEHGFIDHSSDNAKLRSDYYLRALAHADAIGIKNHFKISKSVYWPVQEGSKVRITDGEHFLRNGLVKLKTGYYYVDDQGYALRNSMKKVNGDTFYFDEDGESYRGLLTINGNQYYFDWNTYKLRRDGWIWFYNDSDYRYADPETGVLVRGEKTIDGDTYFFDNAGFRDHGLIEHDGKLYYYDWSTYKLRRNEWIWFWRDEAYRYADASGELLRGYQTINGKEYYFDKNGLSDGKPVANTTKIVKEDGKIRAISNNSYLKNQWYANGDIYYYFDSNGYALRNGLHKIDNDTYCFSEDGILERGLNTIDGKQYYFDWSTYKLRRDGWIWFWVNENYRYADPTTGELVRGVKNIDGDTYYFNEYGLRDHGLVEIQGKDYYFDWSTYKLRRDGWIWFWANENYRYADPATGELVRGLKNIGGDIYYFNKNGLRTRGLIEIEGKDYYFDWSSYKLRRDGWIWFWTDDNYRYADPTTGELVRGMKKIKGDTYFFDNDGLRSRGLIEIAGKDYYFDWSSYKLNHDGWIYFWKDDAYRYADRQTGELYKGTRTIDGKRYYFDDKGLSNKIALANSSAYDDKGVDSDSAKNTEEEKLDHKPEPIMGSAQLTPDQMAAYFKKASGTRLYPAEDLKKLGAPTIEDFCKQLYEEATAEGVRPEVLFAQVIHETGFLQSDYAKKQANFGGLGVTGKGVKGEEFATVREGLRAQAQHLKAYASTESCTGPVVDKRFDYVKRGSACNVNDLGGGKWAASPVVKYAGAVLHFMDDMYNS